MSQLIQKVQIKSLKSQAEIDFCKMEYDVCKHEIVGNVRTSSFIAYKNLTEFDPQQNLLELNLIRQGHSCRQDWYRFLQKILSVHFEDTFLAVIYCLIFSCVSCEPCEGRRKCWQRLYTNGMTHEAHRSVNIKTTIHGATQSPKSNIRSRYNSSK